MHNMIYGMIQQYEYIEYKLMEYSALCYKEYDGPELSIYDQAKDGLLRDVQRTIEDTIWYEVREELSNE